MGHKREILKIPERVARGIDFLDDADPSWRQRLREGIQKTSLDFTDESRCVLGHVFGSFLVGFRALIAYQGDSQEHPYASEAYGLECVQSCSLAGAVAYWASKNDYRTALEAEWSRVAKETALTDLPQ